MLDFNETADIRHHDRTDRIVLVYRKKVKDSMLERLSVIIFKIFSAQLRISLLGRAFTLTFWLSLEGRGIINFMHA